MDLFRAAFASLGILLVGTINARSAPVYLICTMKGQTGITQVVKFWFDGKLPETMSINGMNFPVTGGDVSAETLHISATATDAGNEIWVSVSRVRKTSSLSFITPQKAHTEDSPYNGRCEVLDHEPKPKQKPAF
jgi:hypothetical protein